MTKEYSIIQMRKANEIPKIYLKCNIKWTVNKFSVTQILNYNKNFDF